MDCRSDSAGKTDEGSGYNERNVKDNPSSVAMRQVPKGKLYTVVFPSFATRFALLTLVAPSPEGEGKILSACAGLSYRKIREFREVGRRDEERPYHLKPSPLGRDAATRSGVKTVHR